MTLVEERAEAPDHVRAHVRRRRPRRPLLAATSVVVVAVVLSPIAFLLIEAHDAGLGDVVRLVWRPLTAQLLWNTVRLTIVVTVLCSILGVGLAWLVECTDLPGRHVWGVLVVVPFAIPDFVIAFGWWSLYPWIHGFYGAVLVMTLGVYPLVYLPVAASLRSADPALEEASRSLGVGRLATFRRVTLHQTRGAVLGGCLLVALVVLAEYGAFEILGYQTFTTEIFSELGDSFSVPVSCALMVVLVVLGGAVLGGEALVRRRERVARVGANAQRALRRHRLGAATLPALLAVAAVLALAVGVPLYACVHWMLQSHVDYLQGESLLGAAGYTAAYAAAAGLLATAMALPVAIYAERGRSWLGRLLERASMLVLVAPGIVIALSLSYFSERYAGGLWYQSTPMLVLAYALLFFPLAVVGVHASVRHAPPVLEEAAASLGVGRLATLCRVTIPLVAPGIATAFCLVFLGAVTELTATLVLIPTGAATLATQFWSYEQSLAFGQAAPFALTMMVIAVVPSIVMARYFDRLPRRASQP